MIFKTIRSQLWARERALINHKVLYSSFKTVIPLHYCTEYICIIFFFHLKHRSWTKQSEGSFSSKVSYSTSNVIELFLMLLTILNIWTKLKPCWNILFSSLFLNIFQDSYTRSHTRYTPCTRYHIQYAITTQMSNFLGNDLLIFSPVVNT